MGLIQKIFGTHSENELKRIYPIADAIEALDEQMHSLSDAELKDKTREFKERLSKERHWMTFCRRLMQLCGKRLCVLSE